ncbi:hypothetical protein AB1Y20_022847 [Prymnesium parvum]|uniref:Amine oxidase n=1 Tax=Prymnesium parvum TaxID=97485 RepID=A0AB34JCE9_PRYPA
MSSRQAPVCSHAHIHLEKSRNALTTPRLGFEDATSVRSCRLRAPSATQAGASDGNMLTTARSLPAIAMRCFAVAILLVCTSFIGMRRSALYVADVWIPSEPEWYPPVGCMLEGANPFFCLTVTSPDSHVEDFMKTCHWESVAIDEMFDFFVVFDSVVNGSRMVGPVPYDDALNDFKIIHGTPVSFCKDGERTAYAVGPFVTDGGYHWTNVEGILKEDTKYMPAKNFQGMYAFSEDYLGSVSDEYDLVGYPPIHQHHFHFGYARSILSETSFIKPYYDYVHSKGFPGYIPSELMGNHGEDQCTEQEGGVKCNIRTAPPGYAYIERAPFGFTNAFNDVRQAQSPPLSTRQVIVLKSVKPEKIKYMITLDYIAAHYVDDMRLTFRIKPTPDAVVWNEVFVPVDNVVEANMHAHSEYARDFWWFQGAAEDVFDDVKMMANSFRTVDYTSGITSATMLNIRARQLKPNPAPLACAYRTHSLSEEYDIGGVKYSIQRRVRCPVRLTSRLHVAVFFIQIDADYPHEFVRMHSYVRLFHGVNASSKAKIWENCGDCAPPWGNGLPSSRKFD